MKQRCSLAGIGETVLTRNGFISSCLARQSKEIKYDSCPECLEGQAIKAGKWIGPPAGIRIYVPDDFTPGPIIYPEPKKLRPVGRKNIYPFTIMKIGEIYKGDAENKKNIRTAAGQIARRCGKKFKNHIKGKFIIFERIK